MNYRTLSDLAAIIRKNLHRIPRLPVVGIPRSGLIAASMIATLKNLPMTTDTSRPHLLVDDSISGGQTFKALRTPQSVTLAVYRKPTSPLVDIFFEEIPGPRVFEWNFHKSPRTKEAVWDIDGVLCDESAKITDWNDHTHVWNVREAAKPLYIPNRQVLAIATGRKEFERGQTEDWLAKHGIRYKHIFFSTHERGAKRTKLCAMQQTGAKWMVESDERQAEWIHNESGLPVLCTDLNRMFCR